MASLDRMGFRGVRSFSDQEVNIVRFHTPLTVIQGANGSGKTTIIECLKYVTTGDMPPNSKGGAFIHDPGMATANEVKAQVRLRFFNTNKVAINAIRNVQVTRKRTGGLTMKTLESLLNVDDSNGKSNKRTTISTKCADMDQEIPALLGVSRAILDNVIFCHQEENNWPLGEPSALKKKFDEIFESSRYQKAVDSLKTTRKDLSDTNKVALAELEGLKKDRERSEGVKTKLNKLNEELREKERRLKWLYQELEELTSQNTDLYNKATTFREKINKMEGFEARKKMLTDNMTQLESSMTVLKESEDVLQRRKDGFEAHLADLKRKQDSSKDLISGLKKELKDTEAQYNRKLSEKGALESEKKHHERAVEKRKELIRNMSSRLGIKGFESSDLSDNEIDDFTDRVDDDLRKLRKELDARKSASAARESEAATKVQDLCSNLRGKEATKETLTDSIKRSKERAKKIQDEIDSMNITDADIAGARDEQKGLEKRLQQLNDEIIQAKYDEKLREKNTKTRTLEERREELTSELNSLNRQADFRAKLDMGRKAAKDKHNECDKLLQRHSETFTNLVGHSPTADTVEDDVLKLSAKLEKELATCERADTDANNRVQRLESALKISQDQMQQKQSLVAKFTTQIADAVATLPEDKDKVTNLEEAIDRCNDEVDYRRNLISSFSASLGFFGHMKSHKDRTHTCLGCNRGINEDEMGAVDAHIADMMRKGSGPSHEERQKELDDWQEKLDQYNDLKPIDAQLRSLRDQDIANLKNEIASLETQLEAVREKAARSSAEVAQFKEKMRELGVLKKMANDVTRLVTEAAQHEKDATNLENDLRSTGSIRTGDEVQAEIDSHADQIKQAKREINNLQVEKDAKRTAITSHERRVHQAEMAVAQKAQDHQNLLTLQRRADEIREEQTDASTRLARITKDVEELAGPIQRASTELERMRREAAREISQEQEKLNDLSAHHKKLDDAKNAVESYIQQRGPQKLKDCEAAIADLERRMGNIQGDVEKHNADVAATERDLTESRTTERNIADNLRFLRHQHEIKEVEDEIRKIDLQESLDRWKEFNHKYNVSREKENKMNGDAAHMSGEIASLKTQIKGRERELSDDYKDVEKGYLKKLIEVQTSKLAQQDLETYQKALQAAIMKFHSIKMEEINERLAELWRDTYEGSDVDCVMIRADAEGAGARSSHNYRVVMVKDSVELDMRGRCSAGQKCLASILIRLALADSFSENCGIMALDEPTTNLDYDNVLSLAESLAQLVQQRRQQSNFQLIVITHDTDFLEKLTRSVGLDEWLRVTRDDRNRSIVVRERHALHQ